MQLSPPTAAGSSTEIPQASLITLARRIADDVVMRRDGLTGWKRHRAEFRALAASTPDEVQQHALFRLRQMLMHAYSSVPYYRQAWTTIGFVPSLQTTLADFRKLPLLPKADIRDRKVELISESVPSASLGLDYTGGTSGTQTSFYRDRACSVARVGRQRAILELCGYPRGARRGFLWGAHADLAAPDAGASLKRWFRRFASADEILCCTVMTADDMREYYERLRRFRPALLYGYPNAIEQFARFIRKHRLPPIEVSRVFCTAEVLRPAQRALFQESFGAEVFNLYCSREHGCAGFECPRHQGFHVDAGSVLVEILLDDGSPAAPGQTGRIVTTDLLNRGMPFVRYVTGDLATAAGGPCECGSPLPTFSHLDGRVADVLYRPDGSTIAGLMLDDLFMDEPRITHAQFVQADAASLDVHLVLNREIEQSASLEDSAIREVRALVGPQLRITVHFVRDVVRNPRSGKFQTVICRVPREDGTGVPAR